MTKADKINFQPEDVWESGDLGQDESHAEKYQLDELALDSALGLKAISIRMPVSLTDDLKSIAEIHGLGYQALMKQVLSRFVEAEKKQALREKLSRSRDLLSSDASDQCLTRKASI